MLLVKLKKIFTIEKKIPFINMKPYLLDDQEIRELAVKLPGWKISNTEIEKKFSFKNFIEAFSFMTQVALICEKYNHHPNWDNVYSLVNIQLTTHDLGGISNLDQLLASEINKLIDI